MGNKSDNRKGHKSGNKQLITFSRDKSLSPIGNEHRMIIGSRGSGMSYVHVEDTEKRVFQLITLVRARGKNKCVWRETPEGSS